MKKLAFALLAVTMFAACSKDKNTITVSGDIEGLRLGTLYFQRMNDTALVNIDTLKLNGNGKFSFTTHLEEPEVFYLYLDKKDENPLNDRLLFFGEPGEVTIKTSRDYFAVNAKITGSKNQTAYDDYLANKSKFTNLNLNLIKDKFNALKLGNQAKADSLDNASKANTKRQYLYAINFCLNNKDKEVAPYIALSDLYNANMKYLDTINNSLSTEVANSKYGKMLTKFIKDSKELSAKTNDSIQ